VKKLFNLLLFLALAVPSFGQTQTTIIGNVHDVTGVNATSGYVEFRLQPVSNGVIYRVAGVTILNPTTSRCSINSSGNVAGLLGGSCSVWGNPSVTPANTCYQVAIYPGTASKATVLPLQLISGGSYDLSSPASCPSLNIQPQDVMAAVPAFRANIVPAVDKMFTLGSASLYFASAYIDQAFINNLNVPLNSITVNKINNIRYCDSFAGADAGVKIAACIADLAGTGGTADARGFEVGSINQNLFSGVTKCVTLLLGAATFSASVPQTFGASCQRVIGLGQATIWQYTGGATTYIWGDSGNGSTLYFRNEISNMKILGNASVTNGLQINSMHHSVFSNLSVGNVAGACFWIGFAVTNAYDNLHCTNNDMAGGAFSTTPVNGMLFQGLDSTHYATASNIMKPVIESMSGSGIKLRYSQTLNFMAGTSESNNINIETVSGGNNQVDKFDSLDLESATTRSILSESCSFCTWNSILQDNTTAKGARFTAGTGNVIAGGEWTNLNLTGAVATEIHNIFYATNGAGCGGFTDGGTGTLIYRIIKYDCTAATYTPYTNIGIVDGFDLWNQQASPTTGYIRQSQASQAGADLLQFTDYTRGTVLGRVFSTGGYRAGRTDQGNVALQAGSDATHMGSVEFSINGTRYGVLGSGTSGSVALTLENGAKFAINNTGHFSKTISATSTWDPPNIANGAQASTTVGVTGVVFGDTCTFSLAEDLQGIHNAGCYVQSAGNVTVLLKNDSGGAVDLASSTLRIDVWQH
jgi:hypothetical protein